MEFQDLRGRYCSIDMDATRRSSSGFTLDPRKLHVLQVKRIHGSSTNGNLARPKGVIVGDSILQSQHVNLFLGANYLGLS